MIDKTGHIYMWQCATGNMIKLLSIVTGGRPQYIVWISAVFSET